MTALLLKTSKEKYSGGGARQIPKILRLPGLHFKKSLETHYNRIQIQGIIQETSFLTDYIVEEW